MAALLVPGDACRRERERRPKTGGYISAWATEGQIERPRGPGFADAAGAPRPAR